VSSVEGPGLLWRTSSACNPSECVEVAFSGDRVFVRDSAARILEFSWQDWRVFVSGLQRGGGPAASAAAGMSDLGNSA